jgi:2-methylcitrate dehydratase PrpD
VKDGNSCAIQFIHGLKLEDLPPDVVRQVKICLLDVVGACLGGAGAKGARILLDFASRQMAGEPEATIIRGGRKMSCSAASLVNGFIANALDIDDGHRVIKGHPGAAVFPAVLAAAERTGASGKKLLEALAVGYEIGIRAGVILHGHYGFYHGSGSWGAVGSAAAVSRLLRLPVDQTRHALGIAESFAPLVPEIRSVETPSMAPKDGIPWGAFVGTSATLLARDGFTGIPSLLGDSVRNEDVFTLGRTFHILKVYFKPYPCCRWAQPAIEGVKKIMKEHRVGAAAIKGIVIRAFSEAVSLSQAPPTTMENAEYNVLYPVAIAALHGSFTPAHLDERHFGAPETVRMMERISIHAVPEIQAQFPSRCLEEVIVTTETGEEYRSGLMAARGDYDYPLSEKELEEKFINVTRGCLSEKEAQESIRTVKEMEKRPLEDLLRFLR